MCAMGFYQDEPEKDVCKECSAGNYCPMVAATSSTPASGAVEEVPCPEGFYCQAGSETYT